MDRDYIEKYSVKHARCLKKLNWHQYRARRLYKFECTKELSNCTDIHRDGGGGSPGGTHLNK